MKLKFMFFGMLLCAGLMNSCNINDELTSEYFTDEKNDTELVYERKEWLVDMEEALSIANNFMDWNQEVTKRSFSEGDRVLKSASVITSKEKRRNGRIECDTLMYVFNFAKGFTIVSATKDANQILAYSDENSFDVNDTDNIGPSIWLEYMKNEIEKIIEDPTVTQASESVYNSMKFEDEWDTKVTTRTKVFYDEIRFYKKVGPLLTTRWHQDSPYNQSTPLINGTHAPNGCVPVALAQVVNYHQRLNGEIINWTAISNGTSSSISHLIGCIGFDIGMSYQAGYAHPDICIPDFFCYRGRIATYLKNKGYSASWSDLGNQTPLSLPAIYEGFTSNFLGTTNWFGGHWWVVDGYEKYEKWYGWGDIALYSQEVELRNTPPLQIWSYLFLSFNWGWGGKSDGWYGVSSSYLDYSKSFKRLNISKN
jgi:hypothetical protein